MPDEPVQPVSRRRILRGLTTSLLLSAILSGAAMAAPPLRLIISDSIPPPYLITGKEAAAGLATDLCRATARRLGFEPVLTVVPSKRVPEMMKAGEADMLCHVSPAWYPDVARLDFGVAMYEVRNVFVGPVAMPDICETCAPQGEVVTVIGYVYGDAVNRAFAAGTARRRDVRTEEGVYTMLRRGRVTLGILSEQTFHYLGGKTDGLAVKGVTARFPVTMGVVKGGPVSAADLQRVTAELALVETGLNQ
jgi:ABC-type amino acid transport substrate-binding protein